ncbi:MAG: hypothetical protein GX915_08930 [Clostridiales bacterium]|nr:hypothetical protein [Clostridiales bacterium]
MAKRMLDCLASDFAHFTKEDFLSSIAGSEGIGTTMLLLGDLTNAELASSMGADIILLNMFDVNKPLINGLPEVEPKDTIHKLKELGCKMVVYHE